jgi:DNA repair protein RecN (Recombination protein N)
VGGRLGAVLGRLLKDLARRRQVLCITHLPQVASHARHHWIVRKATRRGRSHTAIQRLDESERVSELAAMLRGKAAGESTRREAQAMLAEARAVR